VGCEPAGVGGRVGPCGGGGIVGGRARLAGWLAQVIDVPGWSRRYGRRIDSWKMPASKTKQDALALDYGRDGFALVSAVYAPGQPVWLRELPAVQVLRQVLVQNYTRTTARNGREWSSGGRKTDEGRDGLPPASIRLTSPYDTDARWAAKRDTFWNGYKIHISETCATQADAAARPAPAAICARGIPRGPKPDRAPRRPNLITNVATTASTLPDSKALEGIHQSQQRRGLLPDEHTSLQAKAKQGFAAHDFTIDRQAQKAICPAGKTSVTWNPVMQEGVPKTVVTFAALDCIPCPYRQQCTTAKSNRRQLSVHPQEMVEALRTARAQRQTKDCNTDYALRAGVEGTIRQAVAVTDLHQARYRSLAKTHLEHAYSAVALNLI
jgi:hypothetical protein